jgi:hypothetical protein
MTQWFGYEVIDVTDPVQPITLGKGWPPGVLEDLVAQPDFVLFASSEGLTAMAAQCLPATAVEPEPAPAAVTLLASRPNPAPDRPQLVFRLPARRAVTLAIYDITGRAVRRFDLGTLVAGEHAIAWDARDARGVDMANGVYLARLAWPGGHASTMITLVR